MLVQMIKATELPSGLLFPKYLVAFIGQTDSW